MSVHEQVTAERVARNDARFREANEQLARAAQSHGFGADELTPYLCECADLGCTEIVQLTARQYEEVRASPIRFVNARGHERNGQPWVRVVEEHERYDVVEKIGDAAEVAAELDPRGGRR